MFCKHDFVVLESFHTKSQAEQLREMHLVPNTWSSFTKKYITILKCTKCPKIKKIVVRS